MCTRQYVYLTMDIFVMHTQLTYSLASSTFCAVFRRCAAAPACRPHLCLLHAWENQGCHCTATSLALRHLDQWGPKTFSRIWMRMTLKTGLPEQIDPEMQKAHFAIQVHFDALSVMVSIVGRLEAPSGALGRCWVKPTLFAWFVFIRFACILN